ncbi:hypothetical protein ALI144C_04460 [Actinosynnema sp. ALI-1.44]|nr:hypothetical protein ALI144C_04460 [Actinosynnema sp. ALI-1.44]
MLSLLTVLCVQPMAGAATQSEPAIYYTTSMRSASIYEVRASYSWKCLDLRGGSNNPGTVVQTFDCKGRLHQRFWFMRSGTPGLFHMGAFAYCLGTQNASTAENTPIVLGHCQGPGQHFRWVDRGSNHWDIVEASSGKCLTDTGYRSAMQLRTCAPMQEPYPTLWTPLYAGQWDYSNPNG